MIFSKKKLCNDVYCYTDWAEFFFFPYLDTKGNLFSSKNYNKIRIDIMANGTVKWFNTNKGYGFIQPDNGDKDIFIHISAVEKAGLKTLLENQKVSFEINQDKGRSSAANIKVIG